MLFFAGFGILFHAWHPAEQVTSSHSSHCKWRSCHRKLTPAEFWGKWFAIIFF